VCVYVCVTGDVMCVFVWYLLFIYPARFEALICDGLSLKVCVCVCAFQCVRVYLCVRKTHGKTLFWCAHEYVYTDTCDESCKCAGLAQHSCYSFGVHMNMCIRTHVTNHACV
jgi:hypothetical protein